MTAIDRGKNTKQRPTDAKVSVPTHQKSTLLPTNCQFKDQHHPHDPPDGNTIIQPKFSSLARKASQPIIIHPTNTDAQNSDNESEEEDILNENVSDERKIEVMRKSN